MATFGVRTSEVDMIPETPPRGLSPPALPRALHPAWAAFIRFCHDLRHGEIERLSIQDGLPVLATTTRKKVKFTS
jgi:hypothetical protein